VLWALKHFHYYIFDNHVTIITDHKTLVVFYIITSATYRTLVNEDASLQLHYAVCNWITKCCRCAVEKPEYSPNQRHGNTQLREHGHHLCGTITCQSERHCKRNKQRSNTNKWWGLRELFHTEKFNKIDDEASANDNTDSSDGKLTVTKSTTWVKQKVQKVTVTAFWLCGELEGKREVFKAAHFPKAFTGCFSRWI